MSSRKRLALVAMVFAMSVMACSDPVADGGKGNAEDALEVVVTTQDTIKGVAGTASEGVDAAAEMVGIPEDPIPGAQGAFEESSPNLLDRAAEAALEIARDE